jgi:hypothetical protein
MSPALSMKVPPLIWNPEAEVNSGMGDAEESGRHVTRQEAEAVVRQCSTAAGLRAKNGAYLTLCAYLTGSFLILLFGIEYHLNSTI